MWVDVCKHYVIETGMDSTLVFHSAMEVKLYFNLKSGYDKCSLCKV